MAVDLAHHIQVEIVPIVDDATIIAGHGHILAAEASGFLLAWCRERENHGGVVG